MWYLSCLKLRIFFRNNEINSRKCFSSITDKKHSVSLPLFLCPPISSPKERGRNEFPSLRLNYNNALLCHCNHSLLNKSCIVIHQVDDVGMVLGVFVLKSVALHDFHLFKRELHRFNPLLGYPR